MRWACAAWLAVGCGHAAPAPAPVPGTQHAVVVDAPPADSAPARLEDDMPRLAERALALFQAWRAALDAAGEDCAAATAKLNQLAIDFADVIDANARVAHAGHEKIKALRAELEKHEDDFMATAKAIAGSKTMAKCSGDRAFAAALDRVGGSP
jgi:hypothetical protein